MYQIHGISSNISDFLFYLSFGEIIDFLSQVTYSWSDVSHLQWNMLHLVTITISHMYTNTTLNFSWEAWYTCWPKVPIHAWPNTVGLRAQFYQVFQRDANALKVGNRYWHCTYILPPFIPCISCIWNKYFTCIVTCSTTLSCYLQSLTRTCTSNLNFYFYFIHYFQDSIGFVLGKYTILLAFVDTLFW